MFVLPPDESSIAAAAGPGRRKAAAYEAHGAQSFAATAAPPRAHSLPRPVHSFVRRSPLTEVFIEFDAGGNLQGDRIECEIVSQHAAIGIKAKRYPLSGGSRFRGSDHDVDIYAFGTDEALVAEGKSRCPGGASLLRWHGEVVTASRTRHDPGHSRVVA